MDIILYIITQVIVKYYNINKYYINIIWNQCIDHRIDISKEVLKVYLYKI